MIAEAPVRARGYGNRRHLLGEIGGGVQVVVLVPTGVPRLAVGPDVATGVLTAWAALQGPPIARKVAINAVDQSVRLDEFEDRCVSSGVLRIPCGPPRSQVPVPGKYDPTAEVGVIEQRLQVSEGAQHRAR